MGGVKRSVYIFLCSLLGVMLFLVIHRIIMLWYLLMVDYGVFSWNESDSYIKFLAVDYITLALVMLAGSWYGIWVGNYWYDQVYEFGFWKGSFRHVKNKYFSNKYNREELKHRVEIVRQALEEDLSSAESLVSEIPREILKPEPVKRRIIRRKPAARKVKAAKTA
jgi:hypothetical protein